MGIRSFLAENKKARQDNKERPSWWHRKKHYYDDLPSSTRSWYEDMEEVEEVTAKTEEYPCKRCAASGPGREDVPCRCEIIEENRRIYEDEMSRSLGDTVKGMSQVLLQLVDETDPEAWAAYNRAVDEAMRLAGQSDEMPTPKDSELMVTSRYDFVPSYQIPAAMIALKGSPTNNIGAYLKWKAEQSGRS